MSLELGRLEKAVCQKYLDELVDGGFGIVGALVCSPDGFEIADRLPDGMVATKLAAMASSQLALSSAMSSELHLGACTDLVVEAGNGRVLVMEIPGSGQGMLMAAVTDMRHALGQALWATRETAEGIGRKLATAA